MKRDLELLNFIFSNKSKTFHRKKYFENDFLSFCLYYFPEVFSHPMAEFQKEYCDDLQRGESIFFVGFRECSKTLLLKYYYIYIFCYKKRHYLMHYNSDERKAKSFLFSLTLILQENQRLINDFGYLYHSAEGRKKNEVTKKTIGEFMIGKDIKVEAMSIRKSPRGATFTAKVGNGIREFRPDFLSFDDIDNDKNIGNPEIILEDVETIKGEIFGGVSAFCQKVLLGNVLAEDTRVLLLKKHFEKHKSVKLFWIPIRIKGKITWNRFVATNKEATELNKNITDDSFKYVSIQYKRDDQGEIGFNQNFNLIAYKKGQKIIRKSHIKYYQSLPKNYKIVFGIDPAFSEKTGTDPMALTITAQEKFNGEIYKYIIESMGFEGEDKDEDRFCDTVVQLYHKYKCSIIYIENNNGGLILARMLKKRKLAVIVINSENDKTTRLREYQSEFERGIIQFNPDGSKVGTLEDQLLAFPNAKNDDEVDSMGFSFKPYTGGSIRSF